MHLGERLASMARMPVLLVMLVLWILLFPLLEDREVGCILINGLMVVLLVATVFAVSRERRIFHWAIAIAAPTAVATLIFRGGSHPIGLPVANALLLIFFVFVTVNMLRYVLAVGQVTADKLAASLCVYLLFGMLWTQVYIQLELFEPGSLRTAIGDGQITTSRELMFFSYVTLTTLGYGDITPVSAVARSFALIEAAVGVLYVAVLVARLVSLYGQDIKLASAEDD